jgi:hypothetical protein
MSAEDRLAVLEAKMQRMEDRKAIFDCIMRNARGNDRFDGELLTSSYHADGIHELGEKQIGGREYGEHASRAHGRLFDANLHNVTMHMCEIDGESYSLGIFLDKGGETGRVLAGRYLDRLEKRDGEWRIALRRATVEIALEGKAVLPNGALLPGSKYLRGSRDLDDPSYQRPLTAGTGNRW